MKNACIKCICTRNAFARNVELRALAGSKVISAGPELNDYCFLLFIKLIFTLTGEIS